MKSKITLLLISFLSLSCISDDDFFLPDYTPVLFAEDFEKGVITDTPLEISNWVNYAEHGSKLWNARHYGQNYYAEFSSYQSGEENNTGWLVSTPINLEGISNPTLVFEVSQSYVTDSANSLTVMISENATENSFLTADWKILPANLPNPASAYFEFQSSSEINLSDFNGSIRLAFRVRGSGTNNSLDGAYQIDNIRIYSKKL